MIYVIDGVRIINCTPHEIRFQIDTGEVITVEKSGYTLPASPQEQIVSIYDGVQFVETKFKPAEQGWQEIREIGEKFGVRDLIIVGSIISAQAYPGVVVSLVPVPGTERSAPKDKLYLANKFNVFTE